MCNCLERAAEEVKNQRDLAHKKVDVRRPSMYDVIHCTASNWGDIDIPAPSSGDRTFSDSKDSSGVSDDSSQLYDIINKWNVQCTCDHLPPTDVSEASAKSAKFSIVPRPTEEVDEVSNTTDEDPEVECTLAIVKPEAMKYRDAIERRIIDEGFAVCQRRTVQLTPEQASDLYAGEYGRLHVPLKVVHMSSGPICALVLAKPGAVRSWRRLMGPANVNEAKICFPSSIRAIYGEAGHDYQNAVHGSLTREDATHEIHFFFPNFIVEPILQDDDLENYLRETLSPTLTDAFAHCCKEKPTDPLPWLAHWILKNNPNTPKIAEDP